MMTKVSWLCLSLSVVLLVWSGFRVFIPEEDLESNKGLIVEKMQYDLGEQTLGSHVLEVCVRNTGNRPLRFFGMPNG